MKVTQQQRQHIRKLICESLTEQKLLVEHQVLMLEKIELINSELSAKGYSPMIIEAGIMDIFGGGMVSAFKQTAIEYIADAIGIDKKSIVYNFLINFLEEFQILGMGKYFDEGLCKEIPALVARAGIETITEMQGRKLLEMIYFAVTGEETISNPEILKRFDSGMGSLVKAAGREIVNEIIYSFIGPMIEPKIEAIFCGYDGLKDFLYRGVYQGEAGKDLKAIATGSALAGAAGLGIDAAMDKGADELQQRDDKERSGTGADLARQIAGFASK